MRKSNFIKIFVKKVALMKKELGLPFFITARLRKYDKNVTLLLTFFAKYNILIPTKNLLIKWRNLSWLSEI